MTHSILYSRAYHEASIKEINDVLRVYNTIAPYSVRRPHYKLEAELAECFEDCKPLIKAELERRARGAPSAQYEDDDDSRSVKSKVAEREHRAEYQSMWSAFKTAVKEMVAR